MDNCNINVIRQASTAPAHQHAQHNLARLTIDTSGSSVCCTISVTYFHDDKNSHPHATLHFYERILASRSVKNSKSKMILVLLTNNFSCNLLPAIMEILTSVAS